MAVLVSVWGEVAGKGDWGGVRVLASVWGCSSAACWRWRHLPYLAQIGRGFVVGVVGPGVVVVVVVGEVEVVIVVVVGPVVLSCLRLEKYRASSGSVIGVVGVQAVASCCCGRG